MDIFFIEHRDPIFGLIVLLSIIFMIAVLSYFWGIFSSKDEKRSIEKFMKKFQNVTSISEEHKKMLEELDVDAQTLGLLGQIFVKSGDFEKAIGIYLIALAKVKNNEEKEFVLTELGQVYFKAGFLQNATDVFLQIVELKPRNSIALKFLTMIDEKLRRFDDALETLECLEQLGVDVSKNKAFVNANIVLNDKSLSVEDKCEKISLLSKDFKMLKRMNMDVWLKNAKGMSSFKDFAIFDDVVDMLYYQDTPINLGDEDYKALFFAKGLIEESSNINGFELRVIKTLNEANFKDAELSFNYVCQDCKNSFPMHFYRCPSCHELGSVKILPHITQRSHENSMSF